MASAEQGWVCWAWTRVLRSSRVTRIEIFTNISLWEDRHHTIDPARKRYSSNRAVGKPSMQHGDGIAISNTISHHPAIYLPIAEQSIVCAQSSAMLPRRVESGFNRAI